LTRSWSASRSSARVWTEKTKKKTKNKKTKNKTTKKTKNKKTKNTKQKTKKQKKNKKPTHLRQSNKQTTIGLDTDHVDPVKIATTVINGLFNGVTTTELDNLAAETAAYLTTKV
jgi:hypothetical protein